MNDSVALDKVEQSGTVRLYFNHPPAPPILAGSASVRKHSAPIIEILIKGGF